MTGKMIKQKINKLIIKMIKKTMAGETGNEIFIF